MRGVVHVHLCHQDIEIYLDNGAGVIFGEIGQGAFLVGKIRKVFLVVAL